MITLPKENLHHMMPFPWLLDISSDSVDRHGYRLIGGSSAFFHTPPPYVTTFYMPVAG